MKLFDWLLNWRKQGSDRELDILETTLYEAFAPIAPRPQFVKSLRHSLLRQFPNTDLPLSPSQHHQNLQTGLLVTSGIFGSVVLFLAGVRGLISLMGVAGLLISWLKQNSRDSLRSSNPSGSLAH